jgi:chlorobactene glucosyltransferase
MHTFSALILLIGIYSVFRSTTNRIRLKELATPPRAKEQPLVTVAIPARNEERSIADCVRSLSRQDYGNIEILVLDDSSTDRTAEIVRGLQTEDPRIRLLQGKELEPGWKGKIFAMQQLYEASKGAFILFTDADTVHDPTSVRFGLDTILAHDACLVSGYPKQKGPDTLTLTLISVMLFNTVYFLPLRLQERIQKSPFAMAIGQYLFVRKSAIAETGGFGSFRNEICDDVMLARRFAKTGHKQMFTDLKDHVSCTMYTRFRQSFKGTERSISGALKHSFPMLVGIVAVSVVLIGFVVSFPLSLVLLFRSPAAPALLVPALCMLAGSILLFGSWTRMALFHGYPVSVAISGPLAFFLVIAMYLHGYYCKATGKGFVWKSRNIV